jgi:guanylate kinase
MSARRGLFIVISGPSGVGKDTIVPELLKRDPNLRYSVAYTTRTRRPGETNYTFVSREEFNKLIEAGEFLEHATYDGNLYGTSARRVAEARDAGHDIILKIEVKGAMQVRRKVKKDGLFIFLAPPSMEELVRRQRLRHTETEADMIARRKIAEKELTYADRYDHVVVNDNLNLAIDEVQRIIREARARQTK